MNLSSDQALEYHLKKKNKCSSLKCCHCNEVFTTKPMYEIHISRCKEKFVDAEIHKNFDLIEMNDSVIVKYDVNGFVTYISQSCEKLYGYSTAELLGTHYNHLVYENDLAYIKKKQSEYIETKDLDILLQIRKLHKNGTILWIETKFPKYRSGSSKSICFEKNITKEKNLEEISIRGYLANNIYDYFFECTRDGKLIYVNQALEEMSGYSSNYLVGIENVTLLFADTLDISIERENIHAVFAKSSGITIEVDICVTHINNKVIGIFKKYEVNKDELFRSFVHEIRNPISSLCQGTEYLDTLSLDRSALTQDFNDVLNSQTSCVYILKKLLNDFLDFEKMTHNTFTINATDVIKMQNIFSEVVPIIKNLMYFHESTIDYDIDSEIMIKTDTTRVQQIFLNIVSNAVKYATAKHIHVSVTCRNGDMVMTVMNEGNISASEISKLTEKYYRVNAKSNDGTGLGLFITQNIVKQMDGRLTIENKSGTIITTCVIPITRIESRFKNISILIVDDFNGIVTTKRLLMSKGFKKVDICNSGEEALDLPDINKYDVLLVDKNMKRLSGPETIQKLRENGNSSVIYAYTGDCYSLSELSDAFNMGVNGVKNIMYKPLDINKFISMIKNDLNTY